MKKRIKNIRGTITPALLIVVGAFLVVIYALLVVLATQLDFSHRQVASEMSLSIAEAGVNYYRWHLAHAPEDFQDGTGSTGPYVHSFVDPEGHEVGQYSLEITPPVNGSSIVTIESTGWSNQFPNVRRTIRAQYAKPSLTKFSFLQNASSWYGDGITVNGEIHSNTGIRMDGVNTSRVTSGVAQYICGTETGCSPSTWRPGVWGSGPNSSLWEYPIPTVDFDSISFDFVTMRSAAQSQGLYLGPSGYQGYHIVFNSNGTFNVYRVRSTSYYYGYTPDDGCQRRYERISNQNSVGTFSVDDVPIIFAEDNLWVEGTVKGKISVVAARFPISSNNKDIWINNNIVYAAYDNTNSLGLIAQHDIYFVRDIPNSFKIDGALMAQKGKIIRHGYYSACGNSSYNVRDNLTINGSIISFEKSYWNYGSQPVSGFETRIINYDANLLYKPPPYFPTSGDYEFISWTEE